MKKYDAIVIGGGGGTKLVSPVAALGLKVAILEKEDLGGTCLNRGCIPSKMMIYPTELIDHIEESKRFELGVEAKTSPDFAALTTRISQTVDADSASIAPAYQKNPNIDLYSGEGRFVSNSIVAVNGEQITADHIFIAGGSRPYIPEIPGLEGTPYMTSREALRSKVLPKSLVVIGAGYIACELGNAYGVLGSDVHFLVRSKLLKFEDKDVITEFEKVLGQRHHLHKGFVPTKVSYDHGVFTIECKGDSEEKKLYAEALLVATGVKPNTDWLSLENTDIELNDQGFIKVNDYLETTAPGVYALGDIAGNFLFRHSVNFEGEYLFRTLFKEKKREPIQYPPMPHAVFTSPQIAGVGKTEQELEAEGVDYVVGLNPYSKSAMGMARLSEHGFVKVLVERSTRKLLGAHIIGDEASDMIHMFIALMTLNATVDDMLQMIYVHPALPEVARNAGRKARAALDQ